MVPFPDCPETYVDRPQQVRKDRLSRAVDPQTLTCRGWMRLTPQRSWFRQVCTQAAFILVTSSMREDLSSASLSAGMDRISSPADQVVEHRHGKRLTCHAESPKPERTSGASPRASRLFTPLPSHGGRRGAATTVHVFPSREAAAATATAAHVGRRGPKTPCCCNRAVSAMSPSRRRRPGSTSLLSIFRSHERLLCA